MTAPSFSHAVSDGGIAANHERRDEPVVLVGPVSDEDQHNTIRAALVPVASCRVEDVRFAFDSSFVTPGIQTELEHLARLVQDNPPASKSNGEPGCPLSVFGHADPVGDDDYNKKLSGRRAMAIYGLITRDTDLWETLYSQPLGNDDWGPEALRIMLDTVSPPAEGQDNRDLAKQHDQNAALRKALFARYMDDRCGPDLALDKGDFLGRGEDPKGKADFQGCSEFNPVLVFSQEDHQRFSQAQDKTERNQENALNRRVMIMIFRKGTRIDPQTWPCPRAGEGVSGCRKRFWSDGEQRRSRRLPDEDRRFDATHDTFACRFYQRLLSNSPCETIVPIVQIRLFDREARPLSFAPCVVAVRGQPPRPDRTTGVVRSAPADSDTDADADTDSDEDEGSREDGFITIRDLAVPAVVNVKWSRPGRRDGPASPLPSIDDTFEYELDVAVDIPDESSEQASLTRLTNLGYARSRDGSRTGDVREFQSDYKERFPDITIDGTLNPPTRDAIQQVHDQCDPVRKNR